MRGYLASRIMRTTLDIAEPVLAELKKLQAANGQSLGQLASDLLAGALTAKRAERKQKPKPPFEWASKAMQARVDLSDSDAVRDAIDGLRP
jgi:hypothetical protein